MKWLSFLSRLAFICNIFFLLAFSLMISRYITNETVVSTILIIGYFLVILFSPLVNLCYLVLFLLRKKFWHFIPSWLITANVMFLLMEIFYILYLNDLKAP
jgi:hypothetical protein